MTLRTFQQYIDGKFEPGKQTFESVNPATGQPWAIMPAATAEDVDRAVKAAHRALNEGPWAIMNATQRGKLMMKLADLLVENNDLLSGIETSDTGKIRRETKFQVLYIAEYYRYFAGLADKQVGHHMEIDKVDMEAYTIREPLGVIAAIVPWNSQMFLSAVKLAPALAAGCTVVLKASEDGPAPLLEFARLVDEAGFPPGVVNILTGFGQDAGKALTTHPLVNRIAFTGGPSTAKNIVVNSAENLAVTSLELGGKSPVVVFQDADLESAANAVISGIFAATGQSCVAGSRLIVHKSVHDELVSKIVAKAKTIKIGDPQDLDTEMGPLATNRQLANIFKLVEDSVSAGARVLVGGSQPDGMDGFYYSPTVIECDSPETACVQEELFGPILSVLKFNTEDEAVALANDSKFGLASGIFTKDLARGHRMIRKIKAGIVWVNTYRVISPMMPFGGYGMSGYGREAGAESILDYTRPKSVWINTSDTPIADPFVMR